MGELLALAADAADGQHHHLAAVQLPANLHDRVAAVVHGAAWTADDQVLNRAVWSERDL